MSPDARLVADIGGTRARFALLDRTDSPGLVRILAVSDFPGPVEAIQTYLGEVGAPALQAAAIALAAPIQLLGVFLSGRELKRPVLTLTSFGVPAMANMARQRDAPPAPIPWNLNVRDSLQLLA